MLYAIPLISCFLFEFLLQMESTFLSVKSLSGFAFPPFSSLYSKGQAMYLRLWKCIVGMMERKLQCWPCCNDSKTFCSTTRTMLIITHTFPFRGKKGKKLMAWDLCTCSIFLIFTPFSKQAPPCRNEFCVTSYCLPY